MKKSKRKSANLKPGDLITVVVKSTDDRDALLVQYIIGYYKTKHNKREVLSIESSLFLTLNKNKIFKENNKTTELSEIDRAEYKIYAKYQRFLCLLKNTLIKIRR